MQWLDKDKPSKPSLHPQKVTLTGLMIYDTQSITYSFSAFKRLSNWLWPKFIYIIQKMHEKIYVEQLALINRNNEIFHQIFII